MTPTRLALRILPPAAILVGLVLALPAAASQYVIDTDKMHASIEFRISHPGYSIVTGRFERFSGTFNWDKDNPGASSVQVTVDAASVDTNYAERDKHIRSADFLDVQKYPRATFKSTRYNGDAGGGKLEGILTLHGMSRPVTLDVTAIGEGPDPWGGYRAGFKATTSIHRSDFGISYDLGPTADTMDFYLFIEGIRQ